MNQPVLTPEEHFAAIVEALHSYPYVTPPGDGSQTKKGFGSSALNIHNKIFAMLVKEKLVLTLPKPRVDELIASKAGEPFDPRHNGRLMKEWVTIDPTAQERWLSLAKEAMEFGSSKS